jgi:hypothetical protein
MADVDPALGQEILDVSQRQWVPHVHHYDQTDHFWRAVEISEWAAHGPELPRSEAARRIALTPPFAVHREVTGCPDRRQADIAGEDRILGCQVADRLGDLLGVNRRLATGRTSKLIEAFARVAIEFACLVEMTTVSLLLEAWQECVDGRAHVANHGKVDRRAGPMASALRSTWAIRTPEPRG